MEEVSLQEKDFSYLLAYCFWLNVTSTLKPVMLCWLNWSECKVVEMSEFRCTTGETCLNRHLDICCRFSSKSLFLWKGGLVVGWIRSLGGEC